MRQPSSGPLVEPVATYALVSPRLWLQSTDTDCLQDASDVTFPSEAAFPPTDYFSYSASTYNEFNQVLNYAEVDYEGIANSYNPASADYRPPSA